MPAPCLTARLVALLALAGAATTVAAPPATPPVPGLRENVPAIHALVHARIVMSSGKTIENGNLIVRDGVITAVGADAEIPATARVWDLKGKTLYPGFIDAYVAIPADATGAPSRETGAPYWNAYVIPEVRASALYRPSKETLAKFRGQGITARLLAPTAGIVHGTSLLATTSDEPGSRTIVKEPVALHLKHFTPFRLEERYPASPMGALTLARQAFYDARWYAQAQADTGRLPTLPRVERNDSLAAMGPAAAGNMPIVVETSNVLYFLRADRFAREFNLQLVVLGSGEEYQRLDAVKATGWPVIVPLDFPKPPDVRSAEAAQSVSLERLMHWDLAPENPGRLHAAGVRIALTTNGLKDVGSFLDAVRQAVARGLPAAAALQAMTMVPAETYGVSDRLGSLEVGRLANIVVTDGDVFDKKTKVLETWVEGVRHEVVVAPLVDVRGAWDVRLSRADGGSESVVVKLAGTAERPTGTLHRGEKEAKLANLESSGLQFSATLKGEPVGWKGQIQLHATWLAPDAAEVAPRWSGYAVWADGSRSPFAATRTAPHAPKGMSDEPAKANEPAEGEKRPEKRRALFAVNFPLGEFGRDQEPEQPQAVAFTHVTAWTCGPEGRLADATVVVERGKITAVGRDVAIPNGAQIIDARGKHLTPGILDCHSHIATDGGVNEMGQTITAEVRIGDFIDPHDVNIYRQLAGGVTAANVLHGSANTIGGQCQLIKMRWGALPEAMKFAGAPPSIKFALGENVKQSNLRTSTRTRYPQTRMGVEQLVRDAFQSAVEYRRQWQAWRRTKNGLQPRTDLELEALVEVVYGQRWIHCHAYRQDEILAMMRACEDFNVRIATFQHILEGYKVADVMARHGVGGSSFSDWWAYKYEVWDAIPYNGAIMHRAGVLTSFNSDDAELARRLNLEASKAIKYGGVDELAALQFVTLFPARQLGVDKSVGSLEPGKDADLVVWSGPPLSTYARCEQTWVDGRRYFDHQTDQRERAKNAEMRAALIQRILASGETVAAADEEKKDPVPREDIFCPHFGHEHTH